MQLHKCSRAEAVNPFFNVPSVEMIFLQHLYLVGQEVCILISQTNRFSPRSRASTANCSVPLLINSKDIFNQLVVFFLPQRAKPLGNKTRIQGDSQTISSNKDKGARKDVKSPNNTC